MQRFSKPYRVKRLQPTRHILLRQRRRHLKSIFQGRFFWLGILFFVFFIAIFYFLFFSPLFQVKKIIVTGQEKISAENIKFLVEEKLEKKILFLKTKSIFLINLSEINKTVLEEFPQISRIDLKRKFPDKISVKIEERKPVAIFSQAENYYFIDKEGVIFDPVRDDISNGAVEKYLKLKNLTLTTALKLGEMAVKKELLSQILEINLKLNENLKIPIVEISIVSEERINVKTSEGWEIYFNLNGDINWQLTKLSLVLKEKIPPEKRRNLEYIDLRFEKVYIFPETY